MGRSLRDKVIVITGASSGIGAATAVACAKAGMNVTLAARREDRLAEVAANIEQLGRRALVARCDVTSSEDVRQVFERSWEAFGRLDAVFANAGVGLVGTVLQTTEAMQRELFEINYFGTLRTIWAAAEDLRGTKGGLKHILICSSAASEIGLPNSGAYAATKAAQDSIAGALRAEVAAEGIKVTSIHPVGTRTPFFDAAAIRSGKQSAKSGDRWSSTPKRLMQRPEHVADSIVKALRRPRPEVWPMPTARWGLAMLTAMPGLAAYVGQRMHRDG